MEYKLELCALLFALGYLLYRWGTRKFDYWSKQGINGPTPVLFFGTHKELLLARTSYAEFTRHMYEAFPTERLVGLFTGSLPNLMVRDPSLIRQVLIKDFEYFPDHGRPHNEETDPLSAHLFNLEGLRWKSLRAKLSPTFTTGKIKRMFPLMQECSQSLGQVLTESEAQGRVLNMKDIMGRFTTDVIGSCAFGINCDSLRNPEAEFYRHCMQTMSSSRMNKLRAALLDLFPKTPILHKLFKRTATEFFMTVVKNCVELREKSNAKRGDFLDMLIEIKQKGKIVDDDVDLIKDPFLHVPVSVSSEELIFTTNLMAAQAFVFFLAGYETSSSTMANCLLELAHNPQIQKRVQADIDAALKQHGGVTYEALADMTYLDKVIAETLRKYPTLSFLSRKCIKPYEVPDSKIVIQPNTIVTIPVQGLHFDPQFYPDPDRFDPERFSSEAKSARHPHVYLPFGEGPRMCIGMRLGLVQTKLGLVTALSQFEFSPSPLTKFPVRLSRGGSTASRTVDGCHLHLRKRTSPLKWHEEKSIGDLRT